VKILETEHLILRTFMESDLDAMTAINQDPKVCKYLPALGNRETTHLLIQRFITHYQEKGF
jgi:RimJ/RimL family protein N-acetyltransferase